MDVNDFMLLVVVAGVAGFVILTIAYFAAFRVLGYRHLRPGIGKIALLHLLSWWLMAAMVAGAYPLGAAEMPDPWGAMLMVGFFHAALAAMTYLMVTKPDRKAALLLPLFPTVLFAMVVGASVIH